MKLTEDLQQAIRDITDIHALCDVVQSISKAYLEQSAERSSFGQFFADPFNDRAKASKFKEITAPDFEEGPAQEHSDTVRLIRHILVDSGGGQLTDAFRNAVDSYLDKNPVIHSAFERLEAEEFYKSINRL